MLAANETGSGDDVAVEGDNHGTTQCEGAITNESGRECRVVRYESRDGKRTSRQCVCKKQQGEEDDILVTYGLIAAVVAVDQESPVHQHVDHGDCAGRGQ